MSKVFLIWAQAKAKKQQKQQKESKHFMPSGIV